jgi:uncharacterized protein YbjT (DUF2867 family)
MLGSGVQIECLAHPDVVDVLSVVRRPSGVQHAKLAEIVHDDFLDFSRLADRLSGYDACLFCLGVSSAGMTEEAYRNVTLDVTLAVAQTLLAASPVLAFCFVSGAGTDSSATGRVMWARVKGETENRLLELPFGRVWLFRPGYVQPMKGVRSRTRIYNLAYTVLGPLYPLLRRLGPGVVTTTEKLGLAMIRVVRDSASQKVLENRDINELAAAEQRMLA